MAGLSTVRFGTSNVPAKASQSRSATSKALVSESDATAFSGSPRSFLHSPGIVVAL